MPRTAAARPSLLLLVVPGLLAAAPSAGQDDGEAPAGEAAGSAAAAAADAFGERVGINQVGLYSEVQTRGFDLIAGGGAFRLDGHYFHPAAFPSESLVGGLSVNVGIAATSLDLPSPTGVVNYRLRDPGRGTALSLTTGLRDNATFHVEALGSLASPDGEWGLAAHTLVVPDDNRATGEDGPTLHAAAVARWSPRAGTAARLFGAYSRSRYDGDLSVLPAGPGVPPPLRARRRYGPDWARAGSEGRNFGALLGHRWGNWSLGASAIRSERRADRSDLTVLEIDRDGDVAATLYRTPEVEAWSNSWEIKAARSFRALGADHRLGAAIRRRSTRTGRAEAATFAAGSFALARGPAAVAEPALPADARRGSDRVDQRIVSATYALLAGDALELRLGAHSNLYDKAADDFDGRRFANRESTWLFSASATWRPAPRLRVFASHVSGLEEAGTAPAAASNRGEVLPPVKATQYELGARYELAPGLALIAAAFDIEKPIHGLRPDGLYAPAGTVRHRGIEASLTGRVTPATTLVLGANLVRPRVSGAQVDAGLLRDVAPGVSRFNATLSFEQRITPRWSLDGYLLHEGTRRRDGATTTEVPGVPFAILGTRYELTLGGTPVWVRGQLVNAFGYRGYYATPYGALVPVSAQTFRLLLGADF